MKLHDSVVPLLIYRRFISYIGRSYYLSWFLGTYACLLFNIKRKQIMITI